MLMKSPGDLTGTLPHMNDSFGFDQPVRRWKSRLFGDRLERFRGALNPKLAEHAGSPQPVPLQVELDRVTGARLAIDTEQQSLNGSDRAPVAAVNEAQPRLEPTIDCGIARLLQRDIGNNPPREWSRLITSDSMTKLLERLKTIVAKPAELQNFPDIADYVRSFSHGIGTSDQTLVMQSLFDKETRVSSFLLFLSRHKPSQLNDLFFTAPAADNRPAD